MMVFVDTMLLCLPDKCKFIFVEEGVKNINDVIFFIV